MTGGGIRIVLAGHTGLNKSTVAKRLCDEIKNQSASSSHIIEAEAGIFHMPTFLGATDPDHVKLWRESIDDGIKQWKQLKKEPDLSILVLHLSYMWHSHLFSPMSWMLPSSAGTPILDAFSHYVLTEFKPNYFITLIDDVQAVQQRINSNHFHLRLRELLRWRNTETLLADILAKAADGRVDSELFPYENCPVVAVRQSPTMLYRLICRRDLPRIYVSFPISKPRSIEDAGERQRTIAEFNSFRNYLSGQFTVFDPLTIDEFPLEFAFNRANKNETEKVLLTDGDQWQIPREETLCGEDRVPMELDKLDVAEVVTKIAGSGSKHEIARQTRMRDLRMIDQADIVVAYRPTFKNSEGLWSSGTLAEAQYANDAHKPILTIRDAGNDPDLVPGSIGFELPAAQRFDDVQDLHIPDNQSRVLTRVAAEVTKISKKYVSARSPK